MFNLISTIIALALTVALLGMGSFYMNTGFKEFKDNAEGISFINQARQIEAAIQSYRLAEDSFPDDESLYQNNYISSAESLAVGNNSWVIDDFNEIAYIKLKKDEDLTLSACVNINEIETTIRCAVPDEHISSVISHPNTNNELLKKTNDFIVFITI